jgi:membrane protein DedA with SNARE-associated domain
LLIASAVLAARGKLALEVVLLTAFGGATVGGMVGWIAGIKGGRALMTRRGPFLRLRARALRRGEEVFRRAPALSVLLAPSWVCGIHHVRAALYVPLNALSAVAWTLGIGLSAYFVGPAVLDLVSDAGLVMAILLGVLIVVGIGLGTLARRRARGRSATSPPAETPPPGDPR